MIIARKYIQNEVAKLQHNYGHEKIKKSSIKILQLLPSFGLIQA